MSNGKYKISISLNVLNHLGINLYSNIPAVLSEVIANAWDADAKRVDVNFDTEAETIEISDDGTGMNLEDINGKFLKVGYQKRNHETITPGGRKPMGRKGIGKLSLFSIADEISVHSVKRGEEKQAFLLDAKQIRKVIEGEDLSETKDYEPEQIPYDRQSSEQGTLIKINRIKKIRLSRKSVNALKQRIARRFTLVPENDQFQIFVDGNEVTASDRDYFHKARFLFQYGNRDYEPHCGNLDTDTGTGKKLTFKRGNRFDCDGKPADDGKFEIGGWIAIARRSNDLDAGDNNENLNKINIMVRGKMAQEDILQEYRLGGMITKYMFGEIQANFLDEDDQDDIATSGRQRISEEDERYRALKTFLGTELNYIWSETNKLKEKKGLEEAQQSNPFVKDWYDGLKPKSVQKLAQKFFGTIDQAGVDVRHRSDLYANTILAVETLKMRSAIDELTEVDASNVDVFLKLLNDVDAIEAARYHEIVKERVEVIKTLKENVEKNVKEGLLQQYVFDHLWLLDPAWERATQSAELEKSVQVVIDEITKKTKKTKKGRIDLYVQYKRIMAKHVIIEFKRASVKPSKTDLEAQVRKYMKAVRENLKQRNQSPEPLEAVCIVGKLPQGWEDPAERTRDEHSLQAHSIRVITYGELIDNAYSAYTKYLSGVEDIEKLTRLVEEVRKYDPHSSSA